MSLRVITNIIPPEDSEPILQFDDRPGLVVDREWFSEIKPEIGDRVILDDDENRVLAIERSPERDYDSLDRMLKWFQYQHLPHPLGSISKLFHDLALEVVHRVDGGPERTVALRKLLEAKDAAVRAALKPGG